MSESGLLKLVARIMMPILIMFSLFLLLRGHNQPGGGFIGGLVASTSIILMTLAYGPYEVRERLRIDTARTMMAGVLVALVAGLIGLVFGGAFEDALWWKPFLRGIGRLEIGTPLLFDVGVYLAVFGMTSTIVIYMAEEGERDG